MLLRRRRHLCNYKSAIDQFEGARGFARYRDSPTRRPQASFARIRSPFLTKTGQVFSEIISSTVLVFVIFALKDDANLGAGTMVPLGLSF